MVNWYMYGNSNGNKMKMKCSKCKTFKKIERGTVYNGIFVCKQCKKRENKKRNSS